MEKLLRVKDIAEIFGCGRNKAYELMKSPGFPTVKIGKNLYVLEAELEKWIEDYSGKEYFL